MIEGKDNQSSGSRIISTFNLSKSLLSLKHCSITLKILEQLQQNLPDYYLLWNDHNQSWTIIGLVSCMISKFFYMHAQD